MYAPEHAAKHPDRLCFVMANTGEAVTYAEFEAEANQLTHLLRSEGLRRHDHYSIVMENNVTYPIACGAGERSGLHYTGVNSHLNADEIAYIIDNSESQVVITSRQLFPTVAKALPQCPRVRLCLVVDLPTNAAANIGHSVIVDYRGAIADQPSTAVADESLGSSMLYSSGTTGRPKGILRELLDTSPEMPSALHLFLGTLWSYRENMIYLSPAPLYHAAPQAAVGLTIRSGGTAIIMERFDPVRYLELIAEHGVTHSQLVPTMFSRMLKLPTEVRDSFDISSLEVAVHAAAPCPVAVKRDMIEWWGPVLFEYYASTEAIGFAACNSEEWLEHPGTVGRIILGDIQVLDDDLNPSLPGVPGTLWFASDTKLEYFNDPQKTEEATSADGGLKTVGDIGYVNDDGFLFLTDRKSFMIISGGVNIYPQETEDLLIVHPKVADAAVFGVPNADLGEEVKALVEPLAGIEPDADLAAELMAYCADNLAGYKCPRSIDFDLDLPRTPTGKLVKGKLRDRYWTSQESRIV